MADVCAACGEWIDDQMVDLCPMCGEPITPDDDPQT